MKNLAILLVLLLCVFPLYAQIEDDNKTNIKTTRQGFGKFSGIDMSLGFVNARMKTEGSAYYFNDWNAEGIIYIKDKGRVKIKQVNLNIYDNKLEALYDDDNVFTFDSKNLIKFVINDKVFRTFEFNNKPKIFELFFNGKVPVYKYYNVTYSKGSANPMLNRKSNKYIKNEKYFTYNDGELTRIKLTKKSVSKLLQSDKISQESISEFIKKNRLSLQDETDLLKVLELVNR